MNLHFCLGEQVQVVGIQVGALVSRADAETDSPLGQLPADPLGPERGFTQRCSNSSAPGSFFGATQTVRGAAPSYYTSSGSSLRGLKTCKSLGT